ncbi:MAG: sulfotransferase [Woeseiaceae bacterium]|nr:sulfotransferase [Woeseiaceae bacterium]
MQASQAIPDLGSVQEKLVARQFGDALADLEAILATDPDNTEALYMSAVCRRYTRDFAGALDQLAKLKALAPEHGRAHQEEGHTWRDMGRPEQALLAYDRACRFNPALEASWRGQLKILRATGRERQAVQVRAQLERLERLAKPLVAVTDLIAQGGLLKAEDICRRYLLKVPHDVEGMRLLAEIGSRLGVLDDAEFLLESAAELAPDNVPVRVDYVRVLRKRQKFARALDEAKKLLDTAPETPQFQSIYAIECMQTGDYDTALEYFGRVLERVPGDPVTLTARGHALKTRGDYEDAVAAYRAALASQPAYGEAWYSLANLKVYSFSDDEIRAMRETEKIPHLAHMDRVHLCFALGKAHEDKGEYETSFGYYERGNRLRKTQCRYYADQMAEDLAAQHRVCTEQLFQAQAGSGHDAPDPVFIVGLPRAGSTLLEQILSSHSQVDGTLELPNILSLSQRLRRRGRQDGGAPYPENLADLTAKELEAFGQEFIEDTRIHRQGAPYFIDKMPNNFRHIGLIHLILPNAKIIDARRHPMSCCFSGFKQLFAEGQEFTYGLEEVGRYYRDYVGLMDHWDRVLPGRVLRVEYEDVVADLEGQVRRMLDYLELPFEDACLAYHETERSVRTPSSEQVRQPIYTSGLEQWRHYEPWLGPLKAALGPVLERYPIE